MSFIEQVINFTLDHWEMWAAYLAGSTGIALFVQIIKKKYKLDTRLTVWKVDAKKFVVIFLGFMSALASVADVVISNTSNQTILQLLPQAASIWPWVVTLAIGVHRFLISGAWQRLDTKLRSMYASPVSSTGAGMLFPPAEGINPPEVTQTPPPPTFADR